MSLNSLLESQRIPLVLEQPCVVANPQDPNEYRGRFVEECVKRYLKHLGTVFHDNFPCEIGEIQFSKTPFDIHAIGEKGRITYDGLCKIDDLQFALEIKSGRLNGYEANIPKALDYAARYFGQETPLFLFFSQNNSKQQDAQRIHNNYGNIVRCFDLGYSRNKLNKAIQSHKEAVHDVAPSA